MAQQAAVRSERADDEPIGKRDAILAAAKRVFLDAGYGAASMDAIAREAGVSKQTIYAHFGHKAALFEAIVLERSGRLVEPIPTAVHDGDDVEAALHAIARRFLEVVLAPDAIARFRAVMAESGRFPELAEGFYRAGPARATAALADYFAELDRRGVLDVAEPRLAAHQFFGAVRGDLFIRRLLGIADPPTAAETDASCRHAVRDFLAAHRRG